MTNYRIILTKKSNKGKVSKDESLITNFRMITRHNDPNDTFKIWKEKKQKGENVEWKRGILIEKFNGKTAEEIKDHVEKELEILKEKLKDEVKVKWKTEEY